MTAILSTNSPEYVRYARYGKADFERLASGLIAELGFHKVVPDGADDLSNAACMLAVSGFGDNFYGFEVHVSPCTIKIGVQYLLTAFTVVNGEHRWEPHFTGDDFKYVGTHHRWDTIPSFPGEKRGFNPLFLEAIKDNFERRVEGVKQKERDRNKFEAFCNAVGADEKGCVSISTYNIKVVTPIFSTSEAKEPVLRIHADIADPQKAQAILAILRS